jgi:hypothetical protein
MRNYELECQRTGTTRLASKKHRQMEPSNVRNVEMENSDVKTGVTEAETTGSNARPTDGGTNGSRNTPRASATGVDNTKRIVWRLAQAWAFSLRALSTSIFWCAFTLGCGPAVIPRKHSSRGPCGF